jgi:hypothetical protein
MDIASIGRTGRSLVVIAQPSSRAGEPPRVEPSAPCCAVRIDRRADFLVQLIATRDGLEQTRLRRRAAPAEAACAYRDSVERRRSDAAPAARVA